MTEVQLDKIKGVFYGQAIGDALGLGTEFMSKSDIARYYPNGFSHYAQIIQDDHRKRWVKGDWTDDTDQFLCICHSIIQANCVDELSFAEELFRWFKGTPMGIGNTVYRVVTIPQFTLCPHKAAELVWKLSRKQNASNGAIMRTSILGTYEFWDDKKVVENTEKIARVTHFDNRAVGSCVVLTLLIANLVKDSSFLDVNQLCQIADKYDYRIRPFIEGSKTDQIENLYLDEPTSLGYTLKAMSAGLWSFFNCSNFEEGILKVVQEGGDSDTNASVAGSLLGAKYGFSSIPEKYVQGLVYKDILELTFNDYIKHIKQFYFN